MSAGGDFWSRRKAAVAAEARAEAEARRAAAAALPETEAPGDNRTDAEILAELGLPDPDTLETGAEIRAFLAKAVPERIRRRALRRLWRTNPVLANLDSLVEYGEDYTDSATVPDLVVTAWKVGRGFAEKLAEDAERGREPEAAAASADDDAAAEPVAEADEAEDAVVAEALHQDAPEAGAPDEPRPPRHRRRMTFEFPEENATA